MVRVAGNSEEGKSVLSETALVGREFRQPAERGRDTVRDYLTDLAILATAYLVATYLRRELPFGKFVGTNYEWHSALLYETIALGLAVAYAVRVILELRGNESPSLRFWTAIGGIVTSSLALTLLDPRQSGLEKGYFALSALLLTILIVPVHSHIGPDDSRVTIAKSLRRLWSNRALLKIWVQYNVQSRYSQAALGVLWIVLLPLTTAFVMSVVFSQIMRIPIRDAPFITFFLAGFVPWGLFNQSVAAGMRAIISAMGLINQIYFPREIIVLSALGEALIDALFMFLAMVLVNTIVGVHPNWLYLLLPFLLLLEVALSLAVMFVVSWLSVLVRDVPQLVSVMLQILFYLSPIIYPVSIIPHRYRFLVTLNPIAVIVEAFHQIIVYGKAPDWYSLLYPAALAVALLIFGYRLFKTNEDRMADMV